MINFEVNGNKYIGVELHEECIDFTVEANIFFWRDEDDNQVYMTLLPEGSNYEIMGIADGLSLRQMYEILDLGWGTPHPDDHNDMTTELINEWIEFLKVKGLTNNTLIIKIIT